MCILLIKPQDETKMNIIEKKVFQIINDQIPNIVSNIKDKKSAFQHFTNFQFVWIDFEFHKKFKRNLKIIGEKQEEFFFEDFKALALLPNNKKISTLINIVDFEDWVLDLIETPENQHYTYISETFNEDFTHYLKNKDDDFWKV